MGINYNISLHSYINKNKKSKLIVYVRIKNKRIYLKHNIPPVSVKLWNPDVKMLKPKTDEEASINYQIFTLVNRIEEAKNKMIKSGQQESEYNFMKYYENTSNFLEFYNKRLQFIEGNYAHGTFKHYKVTRAKLSDFVIQAYKMPIESLNIEDVDINFIENFESFLKKSGIRINTVATHLKKLNKILNDALREDLIDKNPFVKFRIRLEKTERDYLDLEEFKSLFEIYQNNLSNKNRLNKTLAPFLFCCVTGLRFTECKNLKYKNIVNDELIFISGKKTNAGTTKRRVPLIEYSQKILENEIKDLNQKPDPDNLLFPGMLSNQKSNIHLKAVQMLTNLNKNLTFHVSRHSFASISLGLGLNMKYVQEILGHSSIKVTLDTYSHILRKDLHKEMGKWNAEI